MNSALSQTYPYIELILINDGSTDGSLAILQDYADQFPDKVRLIDSANQGVSAATNLGIKNSKGEYIQFLDADDIMSLDKIDRQIKLLQGKPQSVMASCKWQNFKESVDVAMCFPYGVFRDFDSGLDLLLRFWNNQEMMAISSYLTHRNLIGKAGSWDESLTINQDGEFFCRVLARAKTVHYEAVSMVYYRQPGQDNVSQQKSRKAASSLLDSYIRYEETALSLEDSPRVRIALKKVYLKFLYDIFPKYPELLAAAKSRAKLMEEGGQTLIGGPKFQLISKYFGFETALRLKRFIR